ncbi:Fc.00g054070.m01.CDS01 [Cosmosporella sp. VM-42]
MIHTVKLLFPQANKQHHSARHFARFPFLGNTANNRLEPSRLLPMDSNKGRNRSRTGVAAAPPEGITRLESQASSLVGSNHKVAHRRGLPAWDRTMDAVYHKHVEGTKCINKAGRFSAALDSFFAENDRSRDKTGYFGLPDNVRLRICEHILAPHHRDKPIRLNRPSFDRDVWCGSDFQSPLPTFERLGSCLEVSFSFRADILLAFLSQNSFHATFSPYVGTRINPLATTWLNNYGPYMQNIAIEVDMSRLGFGPGPEAINLLTGTDHISTLLQNFVISQLRRDESRPLDSLVLLCRRFHGRRNDSDGTNPIMEQSGRASAHSRRSQKSEKEHLTKTSSSVSREREENRSSSPGLSLEFSNSAPTIVATRNDSFSSQGSPDLKFSDWPNSRLSQSHQLEYCPDSALAICNRLIHLSSRTNSLRMCGFSESYTNSFIATLMSSSHGCPERNSYRVTPSTVWPRFSGQKSFLDTTEGHLVQDDHDTAKTVEVPKAFAQWEGCVQLPPPILDPQGSAVLPPVVDLLQRMRKRSLGSSTPISYEACPRLGQQLDLATVPAQGTSNDRRRLAKLLEKYGKSRPRSKRTLTREVATTL